MFNIKSKETLQLENKIKQLEIEIDKKNQEISSLQIKHELRYLLEEAVPKEQNDRKDYVSDCAFFYRKIFKEKLEHFIGLQMVELSQLGRSEEGTVVLRSNINCFRLIDEWFIEKTNEHLGNITEIRNSLDESEGIINSLKDKLK